MALIFVVYVLETKKEFQNLSISELFFGPSDWI